MEFASLAHTFDVCRAHPDGEPATGPWRRDGARCVGDSQMERCQKRKLLEGAYNKTSDLGLIASGKYSRSFRKRPAGGYLLFGFLLCPALVHLSRPTLTDPCAAGSSGC